MYTCRINFIEEICVKHMYTQIHKLFADHPQSQQSQLVNHIMCNRKSNFEPGISLFSTPLKVSTFVWKFISTISKSQNLKF